MVRIPTTRYRPSFVEICSALGDRQHQSDEHVWPQQLLLYQVFHDGCYPWSAGTLLPDVSYPINGLLLTIENHSGLSNYYELARNELSTTCFLLSILSFFLLIYCQHHHALCPRRLLVPWHDSIAHQAILLPTRQKPVATTQSSWRSWGQCFVVGYWGWEKRGKSDLKLLIVGCLWWFIKWFAVANGAWSWLTLASWSLFPHHWKRDLKWWLRVLGIGNNKASKGGAMSTGLGTCETMRVAWFVCWLSATNQH